MPKPTKKSEQAVITLNFQPCEVTPAQRSATRAFWRHLAGMATERQGRMEHDPEAPAPPQNRLKEG